MSEIALTRVTPESDSAIFADVARIHEATITGGFLSTLGPKFLIKLYETLAGSEHSFLIVAHRDGRMLGFICGSGSTSRVYKDFMKRAGLSSLPILLPKLLSFARIKRIIETLLYPKKQGDDLPESEILNFCVDESVQRSGVGKILFFALVDEFRKRGVTEIRIVTGETQTKAQGFYEKLGATKAKTIQVHEGVGSLVYRYAIPAASTQS